MKSSESGKINIVVGTYEKTLHGYEFEDGPEGPQLNRVFAFATNHLGCIKTVCLDSNSKWLVSGSSDETIRVYNMTKKQEAGSLMHHEGNVSCSDFFGSTHFLTGGDEGSIAIWRRKNMEWELVKPMKGHKLGINSVSIHPSGKLALSCSRDRTMRLWNLVNGRAAFDQKLSYAEIVKWSPSGNAYAICSFDTIRIFDAKGPKITEVTYPQYKHILAFTFLTDTVFAAGGEDRQVTVWDFSKATAEKAPTVLFTLDDFSNRVKGLCTAPNKGKYPYLISISSDGSLKVWDLNKSSKEAICETEISGRLVCVTASAVGNEEAKPKNLKRKRPSAKDTSNVEEESEEEPGEDSDEDDSDDESEVEAPKNQKGILAQAVPDSDEDSSEDPVYEESDDEEMSSFESDDESISVESGDEDENSEEPVVEAKKKQAQAPKQEVKKQAVQQQKPGQKPAQDKKPTQPKQQPKQTQTQKQPQQQAKKQNQPKQNQQSKQSPNKANNNKNNSNQQQRSPKFQNNKKQGGNQQGKQNNKNQSGRPTKKQRLSK